ncbi:MAG TPA: glycosyltransferase N-terminal domain-containing protein [Terriglobales bacterium]|nr:glycosyltransferase N-terminal domain-containing protein [Terriglobales bacterium]
MSLAWWLLRAAAPCAGAVLSLARPLAPREERALWDERLGGAPLTGGADAWIHAASLGEATAVAPLLRELTRSRPGARCVLSATTRAGRSRLGGLGAPAGLAPFDTPQAVSRFFRGVAPRRLFLIETELWPHWLLRARAADVPVAVVSARLSARSLAGYRHLGRPFRALVAGLAAVLCQTASDLERWRALGARAERSAVTGNLKDDGLPEPARDRAAARASAGLDPARLLLVLGSVRPGEAAMLARAWRRLPAALRGRWQVAAIPRHREASADLEREAAAAGQEIARPGEARRPGTWAWDDRLGVLARYYAAAEVAFVGGSLVPLGGHNPLEPAACGAALLMGAHHEHQRDAVEALVRAGALRVAADEEELAAALALWLGDAPARERAGAAALATAAARKGAARRTVAQLEEWGLWPPG